jgi:hypothetical protein
MLHAVGLYSGLRNWVSPRLLARIPPTILSPWSGDLPPLQFLERGIEGVRTNRAATAIFTGGKKQKTVFRLYTHPKMRYYLPEGA